MLTTLVLVAATVAPVNFVHGYKENDKLTYEMKLVTDAPNMIANMTFDLTVGATKDGKTSIKVLFTQADMGGFGTMDDKGPFELTVDKNGIPLAEGLVDDDGPLVITLLTTYLPDKQLDVGESFEFTREKGDASVTSKGKFTGMEILDGTSYAVLESVAVIKPNVDEPGTLKFKTYYSPASKRVERTSAVLEVPNRVFNIALKLKK